MGRGNCSTPLLGWSPCKQLTKGLNIGSGGVIGPTCQRGVGLHTLEILDDTLMIF